MRAWALASIAHTPIVEQNDGLRKLNCASFEMLKTGACVFAAIVVSVSIEAVYAKTSGSPQSRVDTIIIHAVSGPSCTAGRVVHSGARGDAGRWKRFFDTHPFLGIHYVVDRVGTVLASTPENRIANHARGHNAGTIGIELVNEGDGVEPFGEKQLDALIGLIKSIRSRHQIVLSNIKGHAEVDTRTFLCGGG